MASGSDIAGAPATLNGKLYWISAAALWILTLSQKDSADFAREEFMKFADSVSHSLALSRGIEGIGCESAKGL